MTVLEIYDQAKQFTAGERRELLLMLRENLAPEPPAATRDQEHLIELLREGMDYSNHKITHKKWRWLN